MIGRRGCPFKILRRRSGASLKHFDLLNQLFLLLAEVLITISPLRCKVGLSSGPQLLIFMNHLFIRRFPFLNLLLVAQNSTLCPGQEEVREGMGEGAPGVSEEKMKMNRYRKCPHGLGSDRCIQQLHWS
jgi:hypothetical protein